MLRDTGSEYSGISKWHAAIVEIVQYTEVTAKERVLF